MGFVARMEVFFSAVGQYLPNEVQRANFAAYAVGLGSDAERKSVEPLAARLWPERANAAHQALCYFLRETRWDDHAVRRAGAAWALWAATRGGPVRGAIIDDTGMLKQGKHSVAVQRQYTGSIGKTANCQVVVTLSAFTDHDTVPIEAMLYVPEEWANDPVRREEARIPPEVVFQTKPEQAMALLRQAHGDGVPMGDVIYFDADYGRCRALRQTVTEIGCKYVASVHCSQHIWDTAGVWTKPMTVAEYAACMKPQQFRRLSWRESSNGKKLSARFSFFRVFVTEDGREPDRTRDKTEWLIIEWRDGDTKPQHFTLTTLPANTTKHQLMHKVKQRWRTERMYEDLKGEVGFDHFEGRSWPGWHHHVSVAFCVFAMLVAERCVAFPPGTSRATAPRADN